ncbi:MAG: aldehyde dehydrogenase family protein, partial [Deltaproteobacteria bacterium]|nr:aldehyde dehydrogenase family protein [Deltaproteobacteria bacterium]
GIVFALLAGNCVVFKPSPEVPLTGRKIEEVFGAANLPEGVFNLVQAPDDQLGTMLLEPPVKKVIFTGSTKVGRWIQETASRNLIPTVMELGGKDPMIVLDDADLELAANGAVWAAFMNCGQTCSSVERLYVHKSLHEKFTALLLEKTRRLRIGFDPGNEVDIGPLINERQLKTVEDHVVDALKKGARLVHGGKMPENLKGYFYEPTILTDVNHNMKVMREAPFGPVRPVMAYDNDEEAIALANDSNYGLTASVWSRVSERARAIARRLDAGTVTINDHAFSYGLCETPWQGMKESGLGRSHSDAGLLEFVYPKHISTDTSPFSAKRKPWWFPYSKEGFEVQKDFMGSVIDRSKI